MIPLQEIKYLYEKQIEGKGHENHLSMLVSQIMCQCDYTDAMSPFWKLCY